MLVVDASILDGVLAVRVVMVDVSCVDEFVDSVEVTIHIHRHTFVESVDAVRVVSVSCVV